MTQTTDAALVERLRDEARDLQKAAWGRSDGGQDCSISAMLADEAADTIEAQARRIEALEGRAVVNDFQRAAFDVFATKLDGRVIQVGFLPADQCLSDDGEKVRGFTLFPEDGSEPEIWISDDTPVRGVPDVLFHELAHVLAGLDAGHDERWKAIEDSLWADLDRICTSPEPTQ